MDIHYEKYCNHKNVITDYQNGAEVCTDCGLVLEDKIFRYCHNTSSGQEYKQITNEIEDEYWIGMTNQLFLSATNLIREISEKFNIPNIVCSYACKLLAKNETQLKTNNVSQICAFYFYESAKHFNVERTFLEICYMFNVSTKKFLSKAAKVTKSKCQIDDLLPSHQLPRIEFNPPLSFKDLKKIGFQADKLFARVNACPNSVLAFTIYQYFVISPSIKKMSMNKVSYLCHVSATSIKRLNTEKNIRILQSYLKWSH